MASELGTVNRDEHGKVEIYLKTSKKIVKVFTVDAREIIASGEGTLDIPVEEKPEAAEAGETIDFNSYTVPELKAFAEIAKIENAKDMKKPELVEVLTKAGFKPEAAEAGE